MRKLFVFILLFLAIVYFFSGRYEVVRQNYEERGWEAIMDEPFWLLGRMERIGGFLYQKVYDFVDGKSIEDHRYDVVDEAAK